MFLSTIPDNLGQYYPSGYYPIPSSTERLDRIAQRQRHRIEIVQRFVSGGRLLDIGPAQGHFVHLAKQAGFKISTIEMDERCCQYLREVVGVDAIQSDDPAAVLPRLAPQQVITLWHVIEHLPHPWLCLQRAADLLEPGGILLVGTPNPEALQFRILRSRWVHLDAPRHVQLIPAQLLADRLASQGLRPLLITSSDKGGQELNVNGWRRSLMNQFTRRPVQVAAWGVGSVIAPLASSAESRDLRGSAYTAVFRKIGDGEFRDVAPGT